MNGFELLSPREREVLELVVRGGRSQEIADALGISLRTVKMHRTNIMLKTNARNVTTLVFKYFESRDTRVNASDRGEKNS